MIHITDLAYNKIKKLVIDQNKVGIRIGVKTTGCSGLAYVLEYVNDYKHEAGIINYGQKDFVVLVDMKSDVYVNEMTVDWVRQGLNEGFNFVNPKERDRCGCGESFRV